MSYGVLLTTDTGDVWVSPESIPLALLTKKTATVVNGSAQVIQTFDSSQPIIPFVYCSSVGTLKMDIVNGTCTINLTNALSGARIEVYFFSIFTQPLPDYGLAIWNKNGTCILTNETKTLADLVRVGGSGTASDNGIGTNAWYSGKWACIPQYMGIAVGIIHSGGTRPWQSNYRAIAHAEKGGSRVIAYGDGGSPTGVENLGFTDGHGNVIITRVDMYD